MSEPNSNDGQQYRRTEHSDDKVRVPPEVFAQLEALRESGHVNMYTEIQSGLRHFGFTEARRWVEMNQQTYFEGFTRGFAPTNPDAVNKIDPSTLDTPTTSEGTREDATTNHEKMLLDYLEDARRLSNQEDTYYTDGEWREVSALTEEERELAQLFDKGVDCQPRQCYRNALLTAASFGNQYDVTYVEGYVMVDSVVSPLAHAWVELKGKVVELTLPDGPQPDDDAAYLGIEYGLDRVESKVYDEQVAEPLTPS